MPDFPLPIRTRVDRAVIRLLSQLHTPPLPATHVRAGRRQTLTPLAAEATRTSNQRPRVARRVRRRHCCRPLPSEPCVRVSPHTAQAIDPKDHLPRFTNTHFVCDELTVTFSLIFAARLADEFGRSPVGSQRPFRLANGPIQPVMNSRRLSTAGVRLLRHPIPTEDFSLSCDRPTRPRSDLDFIGLTTFRWLKMRLV